MDVVWFCIGAGTLLIFVRRAFAREVWKSQPAWVRRTYDVDAMARSVALVGGLLIAFGMIFLGIWVFN